MITVHIPATSANIGAGFDSLGLAVSLYNTLHIDSYDGILVESLDDVSIPTGENNLVVKSMRQLYELCGRPFEGIHLRQKSPIPLSRGLGSSSACIVGGLLGANQLLGQPFSRDELLDIATSIEGHPDNVAPAFLGGFVTSVYDGQHVHQIKLPIPDDLMFVAAIPDFKLKTSTARGVLPDSYSRGDAIYNLSRAAMISSAMLTGQYAYLKVATGDRIHQPYRLPLIEGGEAVMKAMDDLGAYASYISGAGSTIMAMIPAQSGTFIEDLSMSMRKLGLAGWRVELLKADNDGAILITE